MSAPHPIEGIWQMVRAELAGEQAPELAIKEMTFELRGGTYVVRFAGEEAERGVYEVAGRDELRTLHLKAETGLNAGRIIPSIYQLVGDRLRVCYGLDQIAPTDFSTCAEKQHYLASYRRLSR